MPQAVAAVPPSSLPWVEPVPFFHRGLSTSFNADGTLNVPSVGQGDEIQCIEIGGRSDFDQLYVFTDGIRPRPPSAPATVYTYDPQLSAKLVHVGRPWVGLCKGPICVMPRNGVWSLNNARDSSAYNLVDVELLLHRRMPMHVARYRPDKTYRARGTLASGNTAAFNALSGIVAFGREDALFNFFTNISTSGTITFRVYSIVAALGAGSEELLDTIAVTTAGPSIVSREYEGKVDGYVVTVQGATMNDAASIWDVNVELRDKRT